ncbi:unnamed protein product [Meganyctiphanes norvegica]|uniref:Metalloendopeptidase n=1 Tax=Meganyctiphanes norvegica TaxID=48144 RepID=A0AAV2PYG4_MEGNR
MKTLHCILLVVLATSNSCWSFRVNTKQVPDGGEVTSFHLRGGGHRGSHNNIKGGGLSDDSLPRDDYVPPTYENIPIGDPLDNYDVDIGAPLSKADLEYNNTFLDGPVGGPRDDLGVDPITLAGLYQGDIIIKSREDLKDLTTVFTTRSAVSYDRRLWPNGIIPYTISSAFDDRERSQIAKAMAAFQKNTCLTFVPKQGHNDFIHIYKGQGCSSAVGRQFGRQSVSLGSGCVYFGTIVHEFMHTAGFWHEQSRFDRDDFVTIIWDNIIDGLAYNFDKNNQGATSNLGLSYDYNSLMHYGPNAFAKDRRYPTIVPKQEGASIGNRKDFSKLDLEGLNRLYKCSDKPDPSPKPTTTTTTPKPNPEKKCKDMSSNCEKWSSYGYCDTYPTYMRKNCKKSCNACDTIRCVDRNQYCSIWAKQNHCQRSPQYMLKYCKKSCQICG